MSFLNFYSQAYQIQHFFHKHTLCPQHEAITLSYFTLHFLSNIWGLLWHKFITRTPIWFSLPISKLKKPAWLSGPGSLLLYSYIINNGNISSSAGRLVDSVNRIVGTLFVNLVPRAFPFLSLGSREKALAPGGLLCILIGQ